MRLPLALSLALLACRAPADPRPPSSPAVPASHGPGHADPEAPFALSVDAAQQPDGSALVTVRAVPRAALPSIELGLDLPQEASLVEGDLRKLARAPAPGAAVVLVARVRRAIPGAVGVTVRGWVEHRAEGLVLGDERAVVLFGPAPSAQAPVERTVAAPDGGALHETVIP